MDTNNALILLVEDDRLVMYSLARGLSAAGYQVMEADSAEAAVALFHNMSSDQIPDLALLDLKLPGMSGIDFAKWLKSNHNIPFLFLSAFNDAETVNIAAELGALGYLVKPLDVIQVLPTLQTSLQRAKEIRQLRETEQNLSSALISNRTISTAVGLLMGHLGISEVETFNALRTYCRNNRKRVVDIAEQVVKHELEIDLTPYLKK